MRTEQAGFRSNRARVDHINTLRIIVEQSVEFCSHLQLVFIDFQRAFHNLARNAIWQALKEKGVSSKIISTIKVIYEQLTCNIVHKNLISEPIPVLNGVKQGCTLSPLLFSVTLDYEMSKVSKESEGIRWRIWDKLTDLDYADDISLLTHSTRSMQIMLERLGKEAANAGLKINVKKTMEMRIALTNKELFYIY